jgi:hypothetical protein
LLLVQSKALDEAPYKLSRAVAMLAGITFLSLAFSYWIDKPRFLTEGKLATMLIIPSSWGSQLGGHPARISDHLLFIYELCELFKCAGISTSQVKRKLFSLSLKGRAAEWYRLLKDGPSIGWEEIVPLFYSKFYPPSEIHKDHNQIYNFWPHDGESIAQAWGILKSLMLKCPIHELPSNLVIDNFYARLVLHDKDLLDASCFGSFTHMKGEAKWIFLTVFKKILKDARMTKVGSQV